MEDVTRRAARLLEEAQTGNAAQALAAAETQLRAATGELVDGPAAIHFPRLVALIMLGEQRRAIGSVDLMLAAADREGSAGWRSCALSLRAVERLRLGEAEVAEHDVDAVLRDLAAAEAALTGGEPDPVIAANAHTGVALGYHQLRLYELAVPQYEAAYEISIRHPDHGGNRAMWLCNLANLHLQWALELYQVGDVVQAEAHTAEAERYATRAMAEASGPDAAAHRDTAGLYAACARADREDPAGAAADIIGYLALAAERGISPAAVAFAHPFHAVAVSRAGRTADALEIIQAAVAELPPDTDWLTAAALRRTRAVLLAAHGSTEAAIALEYGDTLAAALWRQRQRTLHSAATMRSYEVLRGEHEKAARAAETDPLTGVANRRGFDRMVRALAARSGPAATQRIAVLLVDMDRFKEINDTRGHAAGDDALCAVARALTGSVREGDLVARLGGDEFGALLPGADPEAVRGIADRMVRAVRDIPDCVATVSVGVASGPAPAVGQTLAEADRAMYAAKRAGGDRVSDAIDEVATPAGAR